MTPIVRSGPAARLGAFLIFIGPLVSWVAEFITAAAWQHYAGTVGKALEKQQDVVASMSGILSEIAGCVIETYSKAIEFIGTCAVELGKLGYKTIVAIVTSAIPIVDVFTSKEVLDTVVDAFPDIPEMPANSGMDNEKQWRIDPTAAPA